MRYRIHVYVDSDVEVSRFTIINPVRARNSRSAKSLGRLARPSEATTASARVEQRLLDSNSNLLYMRITAVFSGLDHDPHLERFAILLSYKVEGFSAQLFADITPPEVCVHVECCHVPV